MAGNEVEIIVTSTDRTNMAAIGANAKRTMGAAFSGVGDESGTRFKNGFASSFSRGASAFFGNLAENATGIFGRAFGTATSSNPYLGAAIAAALTVGVTTTLPAVGSLAAGLFVGAFGAGLVGVGLAFASQNELIRRGFAITVDHIKTRMREISAPFVSTLGEINGAFRRTFDGFLPYLEGAFKRLAGPVGRFADNVGLALERLAPAIKPVSEAFERILDTLGPRLPGMFSGIADGITSIAESIKENPETFASLVGFLFDVVEKGLEFIAWLSRVANWFEEHPNVTKFLIEALKTLGWVLMGLLGPIALVYGAWQNIRELRSVASVDVGGALSAIGTLVWEALKFAGTVFTATLSAVGGLFWSALGAVFTAGWGFASTVFPAMLSAVAGLFWGVLGAVFRGGWGFAGSVFTAAFGGNAGGAWAALGSALAAGGRWAGRVFTAYFNIVTRRIGGTPTSGFAHGGIVGAAAGGGPRGNLVMVGERGAELVQLPFGSRVIPNGATEAMVNRIGRGAGAAPVTLRLEAGGSRLDELLLEILRKAVRVQGGDVQVVLGR